MRASVCVLAAFGFVQVACGQIMMPDSTSDKVMLFDEFDGSLINAAFIDLTVSGASTPINAIQVGGEIWVSDQLTDRIMRWSLDGTTHLGNITGTLDNIRGIEVVEGTVYVSNAGTGNGAPGEAVVTIDVATLSITGSFTVGDDASGDPFDVLSYNGGLLVNDIDSQDVEAHDLTGAWLSTFHNSDGVSGFEFPEQMHLEANGNVLLAGFSSPVGIYEFDTAGTQINFWPVGGGNRGVYRLGNGNILFTDGSGVHLLDPATGLVSDVVTGVSGRFLDLLSGEPSCYPDCEEDGDLDVFDFLCFQSRFANLEPYADCEQDGDWDVFDFLCFQSAFANGCN